LSRRPGRPHGAAGLPRASFCFAIEARLEGLSTPRSAANIDKACRRPTHTV